jgi:hypothetical protein
MKCEQGSLFGTGHMEFASAVLFCFLNGEVFIWDIYGYKNKEKVFEDGYKIPTKIWQGRKEATR